MSKPLPADVKKKGGGEDNGKQRRHRKVKRLHVGSAPPTKGVQRQFYSICGAGDVEMVKHMLGNPDVSIHWNNKSHYSRTPLHFAAICGQIEVMRVLLSAKAQVDATSQHAWTPLHLAAFHGQNDAAKILLDNGASHEAKSEPQWDTPLHYAAKNGLFSTCASLVEWGAHVDIRDKDRRTALHRAAYMGHNNTCQKLLELKASVDLKTVRGDTALQLAAERGHLSVCVTLIAAGANLEGAGGRGRTALQLAKDNSHMRVVGYLQHVLSQQNTTPDATTAAPVSEPVASSASATATSTSFDGVRPMDWTLDHVLEWLATIGSAYGDLVERFRAFAIDGAMLVGLTEQELLEDLNLSSALQRRKILTEVQRLKDKDAQWSVTASKSSEQQQLKLLLPSLAEAVGFIDRSELHLGRKLGEGAFGEVFAATYHGGQVVVKVSKQVSLKSSSDLLREARLLASVSNHPNIVSMVGMCRSPADEPAVTGSHQQLDEGSCLWLVIEYCAGGSLEEFTRAYAARVRKTHGPKQAEHQQHLKEVLQILLDAAAGVLHMHHAKPQALVHRDLAARNILLDHGRAKIADFGMTRLIRGHDANDSSSASSGNPSNAEASNQTYSRIGPVPWMAPESIGRLEYSIKSDSWSFGMLIYEAITGERPFAQSGISIAELGGRICSGLRPSRPQPVWLCPDSLWSLMQSCWRQEPQNRPSMQEILQQLMAALADASQGSAGSADDIMDEKQTGAHGYAAGAVSGSSVESAERSASDKDSSSAAASLQMAGTISDAGPIGGGVSNVAEFDAYNRPLD